jgi:hypothetical protein
LLPALRYFCRIIGATHGTERYDAPHNRRKYGTQTITALKTLKHPFSARHDCPSPERLKAKAIDQLDRRVNNSEEPRPSVIPTHRTISHLIGTIGKEFLDASILR